MSIYPWIGLVGGANIGVYSSAGTSGNGNVAFLTMFCQGNGNGYIDVSGGIGGVPGDLYLNEKCNRNTFINWNQGLVSLGTTLVKNKLTVGQGAGVSTGFGQPVFNLLLAGGTGVEVAASSNSAKAFSIKNVAGGSPFPFSIMADGKTIIGSDGTSGPNTSANSMLNINTTSTRAFEINNTSTGKTVLMVQANGQTILNTNGINTSNDVFVITNDPANINTTNTNFKIKASGEVYARYMKVSVNNFPDYVFGKDYVLPSLKEVEAYYKANKHLSGIPSAAEVEKEGMDVAEMNKLLVKKIEELTIYVVEQNKKQEEQQTALNELQKQIEALKKSK